MENKNKILCKNCLYEIKEVEDYDKYCEDCYFN